MKVFYDTGVREGVISKLKVKDLKFNGSNVHYIPYRKGGGDGDFKMSPNILKKVKGYIDELELGENDRVFPICER